MFLYTIMQGFIAGIVAFFVFSCNFWLLKQVEVDEDPAEVKKDGEDDKTEVSRLVFCL